MKNTTYSGDEVAAGTIYSVSCLEDGTQTIIDCFPEHARADLRKHFTEGLIPQANMMDWKTNALINNDLYCGKLNFTAQLIDAIFAYGFIEGRRSATCCQHSFDGSDNTQSRIGE